MPEIDRRKRYRHGKKFDAVLEQFKQLSDAERSPDVLRRMARAAGVAEPVIDREILVGEMLFGHLARRVQQLEALLAARGAR